MHRQQKRDRWTAMLAGLVLLFGLLAPGLTPARGLSAGPGSMICTAAGMVPAPSDPDPDPALQMLDCLVCGLHAQAWAPPLEHLTPLIPADAWVPGPLADHSAPRIVQWRRAQPHAP